RRVPARSVTRAEAAGWRRGRSPTPGEAPDELGGQGVGRGGGQLEPQVGLDELDLDDPRAARVVEQVDPGVGGRRRQRRQRRGGDLELLGAGLDELGRAAPLLVDAELALAGRLSTAWVGRPPTRTTDTSPRRSTSGR